MAKSTAPPRDDDRGPSPAELEAEPEATPSYLVWWREGDAGCDALYRTAWLDADGSRGVQPGLVLAASGALMELQTRCKVDERRVREQESIDFLGPDATVKSTLRALELVAPGKRRAVGPAGPPFSESEETELSLDPVASLGPFVVVDEINFSRAVGGNGRSTALALYLLDLRSGRLERLAPPKKEALTPELRRAAELAAIKACRDCLEGLNADDDPATACTSEGFERVESLGIELGRGGVAAKLSIRAFVGVGVCSDDNFASTVMEGVPGAPLPSELVPYAELPAPVRDHRPPAAAAAAAWGWTEVGAARTAVAARFSGG